MPITIELEDYLAGLTEDVDPDLSASFFTIQNEDGSLSRVAGDTLAGEIGSSTANNLAVQFTATNFSHVNHGMFWKANEKFTFMWADFLIKPTGGQYFLSAGYGGGHDLLFGVSGDVNGYTLTGNFWDADGSPVSFDTVEKIRHNEWSYVAVGFDGLGVYLYINGVLSSRVAFTGNRRTNNVIDGTLFMGGSDHQGFTGKMAAARIFEGVLPIPLNGAAFRPPVESWLATVALGNGTVNANFLADYRKGNLLDTSQGLPDGTRQIETATAAGAVTGTGNATVIVTAAGMPNSPKTVSVAVTNGDSASTWAGKVRTALAADADVNAMFLVSGSTTSIVLMKRVPDHNDTTLNISLANGTSTGITTAATSVHTTPGLLAGYSKHHGYFGEASTSIVGVGGGFSDPQAYNRNSAKYPTWVVDPFTWPTSAPTPLTPIASSRIYDDFKRADVHMGNTVTLGLGNTVLGSKTWTAAEYGILNGSAFGSTVAATSHALVTDAGHTDKTIIWRRPTGSMITGAGASYQLIFRYQDANNYHFLYIDEFGSTYVFEKVAGVANPLAPGIFGAGFGTTWTEAKVVLTGSSVEVFADGSSKGTRTMTNFLTSTTAGFCLVSAALRISEFAII